VRLSTTYREATPLMAMAFVEFGARMRITLASVGAMQLASTGLSIFSALVPAPKKMSGAGM
jgi:hypothetical protein